MSSIERKYDEIQKEMSVDNDGKVTFSLRAGARLSGVNHKTLSDHFINGGGVNPSKLAKKLITGGFDVGVFGKTGIPDTAMAFIASYYAFDAGVYCTEDAKLFCQAFIAVGIRSWGQKVLGWKSPDEDFKNQVLTSLALITNKLEKQEKELLFLKPMAEEYAKINQALVDLKELKPLLEEISNELRRNPNQKTDKLANWLTSLGLSHLDNGQRKSLGRMVSDFLKIGNLEAPTKKGCNYYPESMTPLIILATKYLM